MFVLVCASWDCMYVALKTSLTKTWQSPNCITDENIQQTVRLRLFQTWWGKTHSKFNTFNYFCSALPCRVRANEGSVFSVFFVRKHIAVICAFSTHFLTFLKDLPTRPSKFLTGKIGLETGCLCCHDWHVPLRLFSQVERDWLYLAGLYSQWGGETASCFLTHSGKMDRKGKWTGKENVHDSFVFLHLEDKSHVN